MEGCEHAQARVRRQNAQRPLQQKQQHSVRSSAPRIDQAHIYASTQQVSRHLRYYWNDHNAPCRLWLEYRRRTLATATGATLSTQTQHCTSQNKRRTSIMIIIIY